MVNDDGTMARRPQPERFARVHGLPLITIHDLICLPPENGDRVYSPRYDTSVGLHPCLTNAPGRPDSSTGEPMLRPQSYDAPLLLNVGVKWNRFVRVKGNAPIGTSQELFFTYASLEALMKVVACEGMGFQRPPPNQLPIGAI
jgi:hypothetical protein